MRTFVRSSVALLSLVLSVILLPPTDLTAQDVQPDSALVRAATATLRSDLHNFVTAQEGYYADHMTYAHSLHDVREIYRASPGVTIVLLTYSDIGHSAHSEIAIDERVPGLVCAVYIGNAPPPMGKGEEGEVVCRGP